MYHRVDAVGGQRAVHAGGHIVDAPRQQVAESLPDHVERQPEDQQHHAEEHRQRRVFAGQHLVPRHAALVLPALVALHHRVGGDALDERISHVRQRRVAIQTVLRLHLHDAVLQQLPLVLIQHQPVGHALVALDELGGAEPGRQPQPLRVILDEMHHRVNAAVYRRIRHAEVIDLGQHTVFSRLHRLIHQLGHALALGGGDGHHRDTQALRQLLHVDGAAVGAHLVHHVQRQHHGHPQLQQLQRQIQVALDIGGIHDVDDAVRLLVENVIPGDEFLLRVGAQGVNARQIHHRAILMTAHLAGFLIHRHTGEIAHVLVGAGQGVEQRGLAAVLIARQCKDHTVSLFSTVICRASSTRSVSS